MRLMTLLTFVLVLLAAPPLYALACTNDVDCPDAVCGGQVCQWGATHMCVLAGTDPQGSDGWCTTTSDCKCMGQGATCVASHCTLTKPAGDMAGANTHMDLGPAGDMAGANTHMDLGAAGDMASSTKPTESSGGCDLSGVPTGSGSLALFGLVSIPLLLRRRRSSK